nr:adenosylcobinamide-GDP ribazoletransferase [Sedimenticola thiotaurini]
MRQFFFALQFLTRLPVPANLPLLSETEQGRSLLFYPLVGLLIGLLLILTGVLVGSDESLLCAALVLTVWVAITGGLHIDGLADMTDAWIGGQGDRERTLEIMKDPRCGPSAVVAVVLLLIVKLAALNSLIMQDAWGVILLAPLIGRSNLIASFLYLPYVRPHGLGAMLAAHLPRLEAGRVLLAALLFCLLIQGWVAVWMLLFCGLLFVIYRSMLLSRIGGFTGDSAGTICELGETMALVAAALLL